MNLRLSDEQTEALRVRAEKEGRSMQQVALSALDEYLLRAMYTTVPSNRAGGSGTDEVAPLSAEDYAAAVKDVSLLRSGWKA